MRGPKAPTPPDPKETAAAQTGTNVGTAVANQALGMVNQNTPYGSLRYNQTGTMKWTDPQSGQTYNLPQFTATQTLSPRQGKLNWLEEEASINTARLAKDTTARLGGILGKPMDMKSAPKVSAPTLQTVGDGPKLATSYGDPQGYADQRQRVEDALMQRMNPSLSQERERLETQLSNQGIKLGSAAYDRAIQNYGQQENDARLGAILGAGEEQTRLAGLDRDRAVFDNDANQQMFANQMAGRGFNNQQAQQAFSNQRGLRSDYMQEQFALRNQPINEIAALLGTGQVQGPNFVNTPTTQMPTVDYAGLVNANYGQRLGAWQQNQQNRQSTLGGLFGLGAAGIMGL